MKKMGEYEVDKKIDKWFSTWLSHDRQPKSYYKPTSDFGNRNKICNLVSVDEFDRFCPHAFKENLRKCSCGKNGSPSRHCSNSNKHFDASKLPTHIEDHLSPNIEKKKGFGASDDEDRQRIECTKSTSSGHGTVLVETPSSRIKEIHCNLELNNNSFSDEVSYSSCSTHILQASDKPKLTKQKIHKKRRSSKPKTSPRKKSRPSKMALVKNILLPRKRAAIKRDNMEFVYTVPVCNLCRKIFRLKIALRNHQMKEICSFMAGKFCSHCGVEFEQFSILSCVLHLTACKEKAQATGR